MKDSPFVLQADLNRPLGYLASGSVVYDRVDGSHLHDSARPVIQLALARVTLHGQERVTQTVRFNKTVGLTACVATRPGDRVFWALREGRSSYSRFVVGREGRPTRDVTVAVARVPTGHGSDTAVVLVTAYLGPMIPPTPRHGSEGERFWDRHALVPELEPFIQGTQTDQCPWR